MGANAAGASELRKTRREAARWVLRLEERPPDSGEVVDQTERNEAFLDWLGESPANVRAFLESYEAVRRLSAIAAPG